MWTKSVLKAILKNQNSEIIQAGIDFEGNKISKLRGSAFSYQSQPAYAAMRKMVVFD